MFFTALSLGDGENSVTDNRLKPIVIMQPPEPNPSEYSNQFQELIHELEGLTEQISALEITFSEYVSCSHHSVELLDREVNELREKIEHLSKQQSVVRKNTKNIVFLRNFGIALVAISSLASALNWSAGEFSWHGDRLHSIIVALAGCGGLAFLGFRKIEEKSKAD